ncbi:hypothetical protein BKA65DRAFT_68732 [Rhexocercosporidium sp. MPI-PUGE-AT-0058]|nr:hypothetical protein BKA65DRAFT_68732 [Rhexocercosporidium sp. MPI-PUGE-AT-0058]
MEMPWNQSLGFINRYLVKDNDTPPEDSNKLRLSKNSFRLLQTKFHFSPTFISSLANLHKPLQRSIPTNPLPNNTPGSFNYWIILPVRVQVQCSNKKKSHIASTAGRSQMNPLNYLHLSGPGVDIRGSCIAIHYFYDEGKKVGSTVVFNCQDGRWWKVVEEPVVRIKECMGMVGKGAGGHDPFCTQAVWLTSAVRWWGNALNSFNDQLIAFEESLLIEQQPVDGEFRLNSEMNRALHCMAAHLHRYSSELVLMTEIVDDVRKYNSAFHEMLVRFGLRSENEESTVMTGIEQISSQVSALCGFRNELQLKTDNVLALLVDNNQALNDLLLLQNSNSMQAILHATQSEAELSRQIASQSQQVAEQMHRILQATEKEAKNSGKIARQSQKLSEGMKKDSVAMKTIALLTTAFLPGTSFAAILSMPFFANSDWIKKVSTFWLWIALTVPATTLCFLFYMIWSRKENKRKQDDVEEEEAYEMGDAGVP